MSSQEKHLEVVRAVLSKKRKNAFPASRVFTAFEACGASRKGSSLSFGGLTANFHGGRNKIDLGGNGNEALKEVASALLHHILDRK